jgi:hypothetical protein
MESWEWNSTVAAFKNLDRQRHLNLHPYTNTDDPELHKQKNHWVIGISHIDYAPSLDMVFAVHVPSGRYQISGRRRQIFSRKDLMEPIEFVYDVMLTFTKRSIAPWTWSAPPGCRRAMHVLLPQIGVTPQLCEVGERTPDETKCLEEARAAIHEWSVYLMPEHLPAPVRLRDQTRCHGCGLGFPFFPTQDVIPCSKCKNAWYHSDRCMTKDSEHHEATYGYGVDPYTYYETRARGDPEACKLIQELFFDPYSVHGGTEWVLSPPDPTYLVGSRRVTDAIF